MQRLRRPLATAARAAVAMLMAALLAVSVAACGGGVSLGIGIGIGDDDDAPRVSLFANPGVVLPGAPSSSRPTHATTDSSSRWTSSRCCPTGAGVCSTTTCIGRSSWCCKPP